MQHVTISVRLTKADYTRLTKAVDAHNRGDNPPTTPATVMRWLLMQWTSRVEGQQ